MSYHFDLGVIWEYRWALAQGLGMTVLLSGLAIITGTLLAIPSVMVLLGGSAPFRLVANACVHVIRAIPLLVLLTGFYYVLPNFGIRPPPFFTAWFVLSFYLAAFVADALRSSVLAIPREYREAGLALGMSSAQVRRRVVVPEVIRRSLPALTALYIGLLKYSTLASVVAVDELMHTADLIVLQRLRPLESYLVVAFLFVLVVVPIGLLARWAERRLSVTDAHENLL